MDMPPDATLNAVDIARWVRANLDDLGGYDQTQENAEASCRSASQRMIKQGWLVRIDVGCKRTAKPAPQP
jgi:hypothetical protein